MKNNNNNEGTRWIIRIMKGNNKDNNLIYNEGTYQMTYRMRGK